MSIRLMSYVFDMELPPPQKLVMLVLCDFANDHGERCHPSKDTVAEKSSFSKRQVQRVMKELEQRGLLRKVANEQGGAPGQTCHYHINVAALHTGDNMTPVAKTETGDRCDMTGDDLSSVRVTNEAETGDTDVTRTTSEPLLLSGSGNTECAEEQEHTTTTTMELEVEKVMKAHCDLHNHIFGLNLSPENFNQSERLLAESWIKQGITPDFCHDVMRQRLRGRKKKGQQGVINLRYWEAVIPEAWAKRPKARYAAASSSGTASTAPKQKTAPVIAGVSLQQLLRQQAGGREDWRDWLHGEMQRLSEDTRWRKLRIEIRRIIGDAAFESWINPLRLACIGDGFILVDVPSSFAQSYIETHYWHQMRPLFQRAFPGARVIFAV